MKWITRSNVKVDRVACPGSFGASWTRKRSSFSYPRANSSTPRERRKRFLSMQPGLPK